jgi:hypothetical protein
MPIGRSRIVFGVVLLVVAQIGAAAYVGIATRRRMVMHTHARLMMHHLQEALFHYGVDHADQCPQSMRVLIDDHYLDRPLTDDWGTALAFTCPSPSSTEDVLVVSAGPDRTFGTTDDVRSDRE